MALSFIDGRACKADVDGAVTARWPRLEQGDWHRLLEMLQAGRSRMLQGGAHWNRLQAALEKVADRLSDPDESAYQLAMKTLPRYTGYDRAMIGATLNSMEMMSLESMPAAYEHIPNGKAITDWMKLDALPGCLRFYPFNPLQNMVYQLPGMNKRSLFKPASVLDLVVGYGAGNVPGTALMIAFLAQSTTLAGNPAPAVVIKNSRREPIFSPLVLNALEDIDPDLVAGIAVLVWDYDQADIQDMLLSKANLVIAAASDETIDQVSAQIKIAKNKRKKPSATRFHAHGHKVSFSVIGSEVLSDGQKDHKTGTPLIDVVSLLATLDSIFWDQHGCLSSRVHFIQEGGSGYHSPMEYAQSVNAHLKTLSQILPRGAWPLGQIHERFDRYKNLEATRAVQVLSSYDDPFLIILDERPFGAQIGAFYSLVNDCQGRVIVVRPVDDLMDVPDQYLRMLPPQNLQSLSVAVGNTGAWLDDRFLDFAAACGRRGVTAIRTVGRGAFPQLSYSWDGLLPQDLVHERMAGRFTTIEFDYPYDQMLETYHQYMARGNAMF
jgi:hypothetical protein